MVDHPLPGLGAARRRPPAAGSVNGASCGTCIFGKRLDPLDIQNLRIVCRAHPPNVVFVGHQQRTGNPVFAQEYPMPESDWWCGEHKPRPVPGVQ